MRTSLTAASDGGLGLEETLQGLLIVLVKRSQLERRARVPQRRVRVAKVHEHVGEAVVRKRARVILC